MPDKNSFLSFKEDASLYGITLDENSLSFFESYYSLLADWNSRMNLVSKRDLNRLFTYHFLDSLKIASCFDFSQVNRMLDFGSGAGFPGIPLSLAFPHIETFLVDSRKKRCIFLQHVVSHLAFDHINVLWSRIEDLPEQYNGYFDTVVTRATVSLAVFFRLCRRLVRSGGSLIAIKGGRIEDELSELNTIADSQVFNIHVASPNAIPHVRTGRIIIISGL
jgi:16S rRNA (guanine527-N7)-methyltransferase